MKSVLVIILFVGACSSWRHNDIQAWNYAPQYIDNCSDSASMVIEGRYQNTNLYMMNPLCYCTDSSEKFTTMNIVINDSIFIPYDSLASSAFEIPLTQFGFQAGDSIRIVVKHRAGQTPKLLNPEVH